MSELKIDFGPGYRVYFGHDGSEVVILLAGGTKKRQQQDIARALERWESPGEEPLRVIRLLQRDAGVELHVAAE